MAKTILLADDSLTIQKVIELTFSETDYELLTVGNGEEALAQISRRRPDLVLADVVMPGKNGYEVCEAIKRDRALAGIPVVLLSGSFEPFDRERAVQCGADAVVTKPFDSKSLLVQVESLLREKENGGRPSVSGPGPVYFGGIEPPPPAAPVPAPPRPAAAAPLEFPLDETSPFGRIETPSAPGSEPSPASFESVFEIPFSPSPGAPPLPPLPPIPPLEEFPAEPPPVPGAVPAAPPPRPPAIEPAPLLVETTAPIETPPPFLEPPLPPLPPLALRPPAAPAETEIPVPSARTVAVAPPPELASLAQASTLSELASLVGKVGGTVPPPATAAAPGALLSEEDVDRIARRLVGLISDKAVQDIAWQVVPELAELLIRKRIREIEAAAAEES